ncbi:hypothetical protein SAY87_010394 [Trapa incisa]|uniref:Uncharacterized protein n=1 Tax=Trapa incisa TaxID=236973 RepID=A0AAN7JHY8_9MYRT|nr:hypothetical protein SAY87_010394 [Trapa incisa]
MPNDNLKSMLLNQEAKREYKRARLSIFDSFNTVNSAFGPSRSLFSDACVAAVATISLHQRVLPDDVMWNYDIRVARDSSIKVSNKTMNIE